MIALVAFLFIAAIASEVYFSKKWNLGVYRMAPVLSHVSVALGQQVVNLLTFGGLVYVYDLVQSRFGILEFDSSRAWSWVAVVLAADLAFYVAHRFGHRMNLFVATHAVHHYASDFNHVSAFRHSWFNRPAMFIFYLPLAVLGFPGKMVAAAFVLNLVVQFWSHNGVIRRHLGWIEGVLVTPRSHRAHHGINARYLDKNFGGVFIFWDRLFGTYAPVIDSDPVVLPGKEANLYLDPVRAHAHYFGRILSVARARPALWGKIAIWFQTPETLEREYGRSPHEGVQPVPYARRRAWVSAILATALAGALGVASQTGAPLAIRLLLGVAAFVALYFLGRALQPTPKASAHLTERTGEVA